MRIRTTRSLMYLDGMILKHLDDPEVIYKRYPYPEVRILIESLRKNICPFCGLHAGNRGALIRHIKDHYICSKLYKQFVEALYNKDRETMQQLLSTTL